jgi:hypothetical protein
LRFNAESQKFTVKSGSLKNKIVLGLIYDLDLISKYLLIICSIILYALKILIDDVFPELKTSLGAFNFPLFKFF